MLGTVLGSGDAVRMAFSPTLSSIPDVVRLRTVVESPQPLVCLYQGQVSLPSTESSSVDVIGQVGRSSPLIIVYPSSLLLRKESKGRQGSRHSGAAAGPWLTVPGSGSGDNGFLP